MQWLGPYDAVLLGKAPLFPMWMAVLHILHVPLRIAEFGNLLLLPWLFRAAVRPLRVLSWWQLVITSILLCGLPFLPYEQRLLRTALQAALTSACQVSMIGLILRARARDGKPVFWAALTGLLFALAYLNREEAIWLLPTVLAGLGAALIGSWWTGEWRRAALAIGCMVGATAFPITVVSAVNYHSYGVFFTTARRAPEFTRAHQLMTALEPDTRERYAPITEATRLKAYAVSPTFSRLRGYLEGPASDGVARNKNHLLSNYRPATAREFFVLNFQFVLQQAAFEAGAHSAADAESLFGAIARELESAIALGKIRAGRKGPATLCAPLPGDLWLIGKQTAVSVWKIYALDGLVFPQNGASTGAPEDLRRMENLTDTVIAPTSDKISDPLPEIGGAARRFLYDFINKLQMATFAVTTAALLVLILTTPVWHRRETLRVEQAVTGLVLFGSLLAFSLGIAVADVLGFAILTWSPAPYNYLGNAPLSVQSAFGFVILTGWCRSLRNGGVVAHHR
jgi:hypothetical protein